MYGISIAKRSKIDLASLGFAAAKTRPTQTPIGMSVDNGAAIYATEYVQQLIKFAVSTGKNALIMRPFLGSRLPLLGQNINQNNLLQAYAVIAEALKLIAHYFTLSNVQGYFKDNRVVFLIQGTDTQQRPVSVEYGL